MTVTERVVTIERVVDKKRPHTERPSDTIVGSLGNEFYVNQAVMLMKNGIPVGAQMWGVCGIFFDATKPKTAEHVFQIKKERDQTKPFSTMLPARQLFEILDTDHVDKNLVPKWLTDAPKFRARLGVCHIRGFLKPEYESTIPGSLLSQQEGRMVVQGLDPIGHVLMRRFIRELNKQGVSFVGVTSMNDKSINEPEITDPERAIEFARERGLPLLLLDPSYKSGVQGSFSIVDITKYKGLRPEALAIRDGFVPMPIIQAILGLNIDVEGMEKVKYPHADYGFIEKIMNMGISSPLLLRAAVIQFLRGIPEEEIIRRVEKSHRHTSQRFKDSGL